jgi:hypothetical protein
MLNFLLMTACWRSPCSACPSPAASATLALAALVYVIVATGMGLLASTFTAARSRP